MEWKEQFHQAINGLRGWVMVADPTDKDVIVGIGSSMEAAFKGVGDDATDIQRLGQLSLGCLMAVYQGSAPDAGRAMSVISDGLLAAMKDITGRTSDEVAKANEQLQGLLESCGVEPPAPAAETAGESAAEPDGGSDPVPKDEAADPTAPNAEAEATGEAAAEAEDPAEAAAPAAETDAPGDEAPNASDAPSAGGSAGEKAEPVETAGPATTGEAPAGGEEEASAEPQSQAPAEAVADAPAAPQAQVAEATSDAPADGEGKTKAPDGEPPSFEGPAILPDDADPDLLGEFITECLDHLNAAEEALLALESSPDDNDQINVVFRAFHTIKGTSGFLGLDRIQRVAHLAENLLDRGRDGEIRITGGYSDLSLKASDALRQMIEGLQGAQAGGEVPCPDNINELLSWLFAPEANGFTEESDSEPMRLGEILVGKGAASREAVEEAAGEREEGKLIGQTLVEKKVVRPEDVAKAVRTQKQSGPGGGAGGAVQTEATIRVATDRLDSLINMVGELVIAQSMVAQDPDVLDGSRPRLQRNVSHSGKIIRELQDLSMSLRMVPLKGMFQKMARLVRDLGRKAGKSVQFVSEGEDTEIDRNMVEILNDPLVHMIRNSCDHGIETAEERTAKGKEPTGTVMLRAYHSAGNVVIELIDDGKGLDRDRILKKAVEKGIVESGRDMSDSDVFGLIFAAGFSTAEQITDVSGRGVGMDVVRKNIDSIRGRIEVSSRKDEGTTFSLRLPLTMAITDAMLLQVGEERYLLPTVSIEQSFRPDAGAVSTVTNRGEMVMLRGELLPVFRLHEMFHVQNAKTDPYEALLIAIEGEGKRCALMVDELLGQQQVVIKTLGQSLKNIPGVAGGAILGDGRVGLILDAAGLLQLAHGESEPAELAVAG